MLVDVWVFVEARVNLLASLRRNIPFFMSHGFMSLELTDPARLAQVTPQKCTCLVSLSMVLRLQGQATSPGFFT